MKEVKNIEVFFSGIDCPNCAAKVEHALNKADLISSASLNFVTKKIYIEYIEQNNTDIIEYINNVAKKVEPDVIISKEKLKEEDHHDHEHCHHNHEHHDCECQGHHEHCHHDHEYHDCKCHHKHHNKNKKHFIFLCGIIVLIIAFLMEVKQ